MGITNGHNAGPHNESLWLFKNRYYTITTSLTTNRWMYKEKYEKESDRSIVELAHSDRPDLCFSVNTVTINRI